MKEGKEKDNPILISANPFLSYWTAPTIEEEPTTNSEYAVAITGL